MFVKAKPLPRAIKRTRCSRAMIATIELVNPPETEDFLPRFCHCGAPLTVTIS